MRLSSNYWMHEPNGLEVQTLDRLALEMNVKTFADAGSFLKHTRVALESREAANSLMLGVCERLARHPERAETILCLKTVNGQNGLALAAMMTPPHNLVVYGHQGDLDEAARLLAEDLAGHGWAVPGVYGPRDVARCVADRWAEVTKKRHTAGQRQRVYELRRAVRSEPQRGRLRPATEAELELVARWTHGFYVEIFGRADHAKSRRAAETGVMARDIYLWHDGQPVSMAMKTRPTRNGISVGMVYTPPESRGQGYATACVGELSRMLLASGWGYCALFSVVSNTAANRVYEKIGYEPICDYDEYVFPDSDEGQLG